MSNKVFDKIEKLLALASSSNPHEAASALAMAQKIMLENGLTTADVALGALTHEGVKSQFSSTRLRSFEASLASTVAKAFGCSLVWQGMHGGYGSFKFIGPKPRVPSACHFFQVLSRRMDKGRALFVKGLPSHLNKTVEGDGWCLGYAAAVERAVVEVSGVTADPADLERYAKTRLGTNGAAKVSMRQGGLAGLTEGHEAGLREKLYQPMTVSVQEKIG